MHQQGPLNPEPMEKCRLSKLQYLSAAAPNADAVASFAPRAMLPKVPVVGAEIGAVYVFLRFAFLAAVIRPIDGGYHNY